MVWLFLLAGTVFLRLINEDIHRTGLLGSTRKSAGVDAERVQFIVVWLIGVGAYVVQAMAGGAPGEAGRPTMPDVPDSLLVTMAGSKVLYLGGKLGRTVQRQGG